MIPFLAIHALAAPRGDGLRPELLALFERHEAASNPHFVVAVSDQHRADATETAILVQWPVKLPRNRNGLWPSGHPRLAMAGRSLCIHVIAASRPSRMRLRSTPHR